MKLVWFIVFLVFVVALVAFFKQESIKDQVGIEDPDSELGNKIDDALGINRAHQVDRAKDVATKAEFENIRKAVVMYYTVYNEYPKSLEELVSKNMIDQNALRDYWQQGYRTEVKGTDLIITSPGRDRIKNTKDDISTQISLLQAGKEVQWEGSR